jgi:predicted permease
MSESGWRRYRTIWRPRVQQDVDDEMSFHFRMRVEEFIAAGMSAEDAERVARERYGNVGEVRSALVGIDRRQRRAVVWRERFRDALHDLTIAARGLRREPRFAIGVILALGLGIAANATMFGVVDRLMLRGPAGVGDPGQVRRLYTASVGPEHETETTSWVGYVTYASMRDHARGFASVAAYNAPYPRRLGSDENARLVPTASATWDLFPTLRVRPQIGRFFSQAEDTPAQSAHVAVISDALWQDEFARDPGVLGSAIRLDDASYTIVGVAPPGFNGPDRSRTDVWVPMTLSHPCDHWTTTLDCQWLQVIARLAPGVTPAQADAEATRVLRLEYANGSAAMRTARALARPLWYDARGTPASVARVAAWLMGVSVIVLLITCANVTNLMLARARRRRREIAVRLAIGASASRLIALILTESFLLALAGAVLALLLSLAGGRLMRATLLAGIAMDGPIVDRRVFAFTLGVSVAVAALVGLVAALGALRVNVTAGLRESANAGGGQRHRIRAMLSGAQAALSVILLVGAGLFELSLYRSEHVQLGFEAQHVLRADLRLPRGSGLIPPKATFDQRTRIVDDLLGRVARGVAAEPWVEQAAVAVGSPFGNSFGVSLKVPGRDSIPQLKGGGPYISAVTSSYFATVGTPLVRGRLFRADEREGTPPVTIVGETMARLLWPGEDPLTKCLIIGNDKTAPCAAVVGVVADVHRSSISESPTMQYYVPLGQEHNFSGPVVMIRPRGDARQQMERARAALSRISGVRDVRVEWLESALDPEYAPYRLGATMFGIFGGLALIIAAVGLYSVIAYLVTDRTREIGVRLALGAGSRRIVRDVLASGAATTAAGILVGLIVAFVGASRIEPLLFQVHTPNWPIFGLASVLMLFIALVATWAPARRASRVDPVIALRTD